MPSAAFLQARGLTGRDVIDAWVAFVKRDGSRVAWSGRAIADPSTYEDGYKSARLLLIEGLVVALSDRYSVLQATRGAFEISDAPDPDTGERLIGGWVEDGETLRNAEIEIKVITDAERRLGYTPRVAFRGIVEQYSGDGTRIRIEAVGWIGARLGEPVITETIRDRFPGAPDASLDRLIPVALGRLSDELSSTAPPILSAEPLRGVSPDIGGYGDLPGDPPTDVTLVEDLGAGDFTAGTVLCGHVTAIWPDGYSNPEPFLGQDLELIIGTNGSAATMAWTDVGAPQYRADIAFKNGSQVLWSHSLVTSGTSVQFTKVHGLGADPTPATITPGATPTYTAAIWREFVTALMSDGETDVSDDILYLDTPFPRPTRITWHPVSAALKYFRYRTTLTGTSTRRIVVPLDQLNGLADVYDDALNTDPRWQAVSGLPAAKGVVYPIPIGQKIDANGAAWQFFGYAAHACDYTTPVTLYLTASGVTTPIASFGTDVVAPGQSGWSTLFGADEFILDTRGKRWSAVGIKETYGDLADILAGTIVLSANVLGAEDVGDASGDLVETILDQVALVSDNLGLLDESVIGEDWVSSPPTFSDGTAKRDTASWTLAATNAGVVLPDGVLGARWIAESITWGELLSEAFRSGYLLGGINAAGALQIVLTNRTQAPSLSATGEFDIIRGSFAWRDVDQGFFNALPYSYAPVYSSAAGWTAGASGTAESLSSQAANRQRKVGAAYSMPWTPAYRAQQAEAVAALVLADGAALPRTVQMDSGIHWASVGLGDVIALTTPSGIGRTGWTDRRVQVLGARLMLGAMRVSLTCVDSPITVGFEVDNIVATFNASNQTLSITATITPSMSAGTVTFTIYDQNGAQIGSPVVAAPVVDGAVSASWTLPGGVGPTTNGLGVGVLAFSGYGQAPMQFLDEDGNLLSPPANNPKIGTPAAGTASSGDPDDPNYDGQSGCNGIVQLDGGTFAFTGSSYADPYESYGTLDFLLAALQGDAAGQYLWSIHSGYAGNVFYGLRTPASGNYEIWRIDAAGAKVAAFDLGQSNFPVAMAIGVVADESAAFFVPGSGTGSDTVSRRDLIAGSTAAFAMETGKSVFNNGILVLRNGQVLVGWKEGGGTGYIQHYDTDGSVLHTYNLGTDAVVCLTPGLDDSSFLCLAYSASATNASGVVMRKIDIATGAELKNWEPPDVALSSPYSGNFQFDGPCCAVRAPGIRFRIVGQYSGAGQFQPATDQGTLTINPA